MTKKLTTILMVLATMLCIVASCSKTETRLNEEKVVSNHITIVPVEEALMKLDTFLDDVQMKSGTKISYSSIIPHFSNKYETKSGSSIPDAYLVNFENQEGFAILGANSEVAPIIAVVEDGNTDWESIMSPYETHTEDAIENALEKELLGEGISADKLLSMCVKGALYGEQLEEDTQTKTDYTISILPLLGDDYNFQQHRTYCHKDNNKFVVCGCGSVAASIVLTYFKRSRFVVDHSLLSFDHFNVQDGTGIRYLFPDNRDIYINVSEYFTNGGSIPAMLSDSEMLALITKIDPDIIEDHGTPEIQPNAKFFRTRFKVSSAIYYTFSNIIKNWSGTGTMPNAFVDGLESLGFTNVNKVKERQLTSEQIGTIIDMISNDKPVFMCGWSLGSLSESHYWVVDGIKQNNEETLIHCNWGWGGASNGWFATDCIRTDSPVTRSSNSNNGWNNILTFSYDTPAYSGAKYFTTFYDEHRVTY